MPGEQIISSQRVLPFGSPGIEGPPNQCLISPGLSNTFRAKVRLQHSAASLTFLPEYSLLSCQIIDAYIKDLSIFIYLVFLAAYKGRISLGNWPPMMPETEAVSHACFKHLLSLDFFSQTPFS